MRVLMTTDAVGGVWTFTQELAQGLLGAGCDVALVCVGPAPSRAQASWAMRLQDAWSERFRFTALDAPLEWMQENAEAFCAAAPALLGLIGEFGADVMHSSQFCFGALDATVPVVITAHSDVLSWAASCRSAPLEESPWLGQYMSLVRAGLRGAAAIAAPTHWMLQALAANFALPAVQRVILNGRSVPHAPAPLRKLQAVVSGRLWDEGKNVGLLAEVRSPMPILVAGEAVGGETTAGREVGDAVLVGVLTEAELLGLFRESAIYLCTSRYEPFGLAALEAALCGCAVIANDIPSLREVWGDAALYFQDGASLSALLIELAGDAELLAELQARCETRAQRYTRDAMTAGYLSLYGQQVRALEGLHAA